MKIMVIFVSFFFLLVVCGTLNYIFILWRQYWIRIEKIAQERRIVYPVERQHAALRFDEVTSRFMLHRPPPRTTTTTLAPPKNWTDILKERIAKHEAEIRGQLRRSLMDTSKSVDNEKIINLYHVNFTGTKSLYMSPKMKPETLVCDAIDKIKLETFVRGDAFFQLQKMDRYLLKGQILEGQTFKTCAVVPSSGSLLNSSLGPEIDKNDFIIRFNHAPTSKYECDVGSKTSLRIVNSQVVGKPEFKFLNSNMYSQSQVLVWDPCRYDETLEDWFSHPDYPFFETFFSKRLMQPNEQLHLLKPSSLWSIWNWMQTNSKHSILPNPPSSGFLGVLLALKHCHIVKIFEYVPSLRVTKRCHYYDEEENFGCTMGVWHPLSAEKLLTLAFNIGDHMEVFGKGIITIKGAPSLNC